MKRLWRLLRLRQHQFRRGDDGQVMLAFALSLMLIVSSIGAVVNIGEIVKTKAYSQTAVDASAVGAAVWMARGSNLLQMINALHWDINGFAGTICAPLLSVGSAAVSVLLACCAFPPTAPVCCKPAWDTRQFVKKIKKSVMEMRKKAANILEPVGKGINASFPLLSALHANGLAQANYADRLDQVVIGTLWTLLRIIDNNTFKSDMFSNPPSISSDFAGFRALESVYNAIFSRIFAWPVSPSPVPYKANKFAKFETGDDDTVFNVNAWDFLCLYWSHSDLEWNEPYAQPLSEDENPYVTYLAGKIDRRRGGNPALGAVRQLAAGNTDDLPVVSLASVQVIGGPLSPSGDPDNAEARKYTALWWPDHAAPVPLRFFTMNYSGDFDVTYIPVRIGNKKDLSKFGVLH
jgi:hypothetical protein